MFTKCKKKKKYKSTFYLLFFFFKFTFEFMKWEINKIELILVLISHFYPHPFMVSFTFFNFQLIFRYRKFVHSFIHFFFAICFQTIPLKKKIWMGFYFWKYIQVESNIKKLIIDVRKTILLLLSVSLFLLLLKKKTR